MSQGAEIPPEVQHARRLESIEYELRELRETLGIVVEGMRAIGNAVGVEQTIGELVEKVERIAARRRKPRTRVIR